MELFEIACKPLILASSLVLKRRTITMHYKALRCITMYYEALRWYETSECVFLFACADWNGGHETKQIHLLRITSRGKCAKMGPKLQMFTSNLVASPHWAWINAARGRDKNHLAGGNWFWLPSDLLGHLTRLASSYLCAEDRTLEMHMQIWIIQLK